MYKKILEKQWKDLVEDFAGDNRGVVQSAEQLAQWYRANAHRFSSLNAIESISLDQLNNDGFAKALREKIGSFRFIKPEPAKKQDFKMVILAAGITAVAVILLLPLIPLAWTKMLLVRILLGIVAFIAVAALMIKKASAAQDKDNARIFQEYVHQLEAYLPELIAVCDEYGVE